MPVQAKQEGSEIQQTLEERAKSEEHGGRLDHAKFVQLMAQLQMKRHDKGALDRLAQQFEVPADIVHSLAAHCSIPAVQSTFLGSEQAMVAKWQ